MRTTRRSAKFAALAVGLSLVVAACGSDDEEGGDDTTATTAAPATDAPATTAAETTPPETEPADTEPADTEPADTEPADTEPADTEPADTEPMDTGEPSGDVAMRVTININPDANWSDGTPITVADFQCTYDAVLNTPGSLSTVGYDQIASVEQGESEKQVILNYSTVFAPYKTLFGGLLKADAHEDCNDVSQDLLQEVPYSGREYMIDSWSSESLTLVPNPEYYGDEPTNFEQVTMVPLPDSDTEIVSLLDGTVDFIYPQFYTGIEEALADPNVVVSINFGADYEGFYFQMREGPFADPVYREAFQKSIDVAAVFEQIYVPIVEGAEQLLCGPIVPGPFCEGNEFEGTYDPEGAAALLEENGWTRNDAGMWQDPDGNVPQVRWIINTGNTRRENTQAFLIPLLIEAGFDVVADNCDAACYFQQRLPSLDYDMAMYISTAPPDPVYLTSSFHCDQVPTEENGNVGQNSSGWCNEEASALLTEADQTVDEDARAELIKQVLDFMAEDHIMIPLFQFPKSAAYRTDRVGGDAVEVDLNNYQAFNNFGAWDDVDGDGSLVIGAEQWPECLNPITECANSSWYQWTVGFTVFPGVWDTTSEQTFVTTALVDGEPEVEVLAG